MKNRTYTVNNWSIDLTSGFITHRETQEQKRLGEYQLKLITVLLEHVGVTLSRDELTNLVWKRRVIGNNSLPNAIHTLRVALGDENKQQRIIQTIPKIGYLLDPELCEIIDETTVEDVAEPTEIAAPIMPSEINTIAMAANTQSNTAIGGQITTIHPPGSKDMPEAALTPSRQHAAGITPAPLPSVISPAKNRHIFRRKNLLLGLLLIAVTIVSFSYFLRYLQSGSHYRAIEQEQGNYSNINLFQLVDSKFSLQQDEKLNQRIKDTLYTLNQQIKSSDTQINIYYYVSLRRLDFTFMVENKCTQQQLSMTIYHWRQNDQLLNNLIYREMERKINETDNC
ncbi:winged helix-turn-helix domain-containing protein [Yersinia enterocolitica]